MRHNNNTLNPRTFSARPAASWQTSISGLSDTEFLTYGLRKTSSGAEVRQLQDMLIKSGYSVGAKGADGFFGDDTLAAVYKWQRDNGRPEVNTVGNGMWAALRQSSGYASGGARPPAPAPAAPAPAPMPAPAPPPVTPVAPRAPQAPVVAPPRSVSAPVAAAPPPMPPQQTPQQTQQQQPQPSGGGFDIGNVFRDVTGFIGQNAGTIGQVANAAGINVPFLNQNQQQQQQQQQQGGFTPGTTPGSTAPLVGGGAQSPAAGNQQPYQQPQGSPEMTPKTSGQTVLIEVENPLIAAARFAVPAALGVGTGFGLQAAQDKSNLIVSIVGGLGIAVGTYFLGEKLFPFTPTTIQQPTT
jgi:Putative peptidoglycan binding domain